MANQEWKLRHRTAMSDPQTPEEKTLVNLIGELKTLAERHPNDSVLTRAVEHVGGAIVVLLNGDVGRLDQATLDTDVREIVDAAGGDISDV